MQNNQTILLIDDDTDDQEIFSLAMEKANQGAHCVFAEDGIMALEKLNSEADFTPDFIFIDMNMPRMNGQQCLKEIKKLDRLKDVPVYMYSTSADPESIEENRRLGAVDFIVKPSSINDLTKILSGIFQRQLVVILTLFLMIGGATTSRAQEELPPVDILKRMSMEELMNIVVTSVSRTPENLSEVASAIQVIRNNEIRRSTALRLPEALRLMPNLQVAQSGSHDWGISARGFNGAPVTSTSLADKLLVMIDGRTVYTPLFGGVFWDVQNVMLEDIDRIEVVSGPGGTLWGSNAVNGVVNVITKSAKETQGLYLSGVHGALVDDQIDLRYGGQVDSTLFFRVYGQRFDFDNTLLANGEDASDTWYMTKGGFRLDFLPANENTFILQGELYGGREDETDTAHTIINGQHLLARWTHSFSESSNLTVQSYIDRTFRDIQRSPFTDELTTIDLELQHGFALGNRQRFLWGAGFRNQEDVTEGTGTRFAPATRSLQQLSGFIQDQISLVPDRLQLTIGTKLLNNDYTGLEFQPSVRLAWTPGQSHTVWGAVSRAVRTPSRLDTDLFSFSLVEHPDFVSEKVIAYELGYRLRPFENVSMSVATFYNQYDDLRTLNATGNSEASFVFGNDMKANTWGFEISGNVFVAEWWRVRGGVTYLDKDFTVTGTNVFPGTELLEGIDPKAQLIIHSMLDITNRLELDILARYIDELPAVTLTQSPGVPAFFNMNVRLAYEIGRLSLILAGQNILEDSNREFGSRMIPRNMSKCYRINMALSNGDGSPG